VVSASSPTCPCAMKKKGYFIAVSIIKSLNPNFAIKLTAKFGSTQKLL